ncbi:Hsp70 family protein [Nitrospirillum viridazoti]|uniref:Heat-shock protein n=1 Tax=Nitrospirillum viridazoti CBAmc TaxID=1441467 RepID=A0A248JWU5_9PROT|nr:Hsp70 family protein [Nitrospirillum amazonense]ASG22664.1 heat-shock protein [Nitrospirillum amazonense CBAmc]TWB30175.1 putative chaperone protein [Nitrospirillum amazonense]
MGYCGLDFGTSNSTLGVVEDGEARLLPLEGEETTLPSALFFDFAAKREEFGRAAIQIYAEGADGRLMRSLKSVLGTDLIDMETQLDRRRIRFRDVLKTLLTEIKRRAEERAGRPLTQVVHGRPVHFVDGDDAADRRAETALAEIARDIGYTDVSFQFEPIAAALDYERQVNAEEIALIADIGGGTSDFSIVRIGPDRREAADRGQDILASTGVRIGGTDFDRLLSLHGVMPHLGYQSPMKRAGLLAPNSYFNDLATWSKINFLYAPKVMAELRQVLRESAKPDLIGRLIHVVEEHLGHRVAMTVERTKIRLSATAAQSASSGPGGSDLVVDIPFDFIQRRLTIPFTVPGFATATTPLTDGIAGMIRKALGDSGLTRDKIDAVFLTGGSTLLPNVRASILAELPEARVVEGDKFGSVGLGLTLEAHQRYR